MIKNSLIVLTLVMALSFIIAGCGGGDGALNVGPSTNPVSPIVTSGEGTIAINVDWKALDDTYSKDLTGQVIYSTVSSIKLEAYDPNGSLVNSTTVVRTSGSTSQTGSLSVAPGTYRVDVGGYTSGGQLISHRRSTAVVTAGATTQLTATLGVSILPGGSLNPTSTYVSPGDTLYWRNNDTVARRIKIGASTWSNSLPVYDPNSPSSSEYGYTFSTANTAGETYYLYTSDQATQLAQGTVFVQLTGGNTYTYSSTGSFAPYTFEACQANNTFIVAKNATHVFILDKTNKVIEKYDTTGAYVSTFKPTTLTGTLIDLAVDSNGNMFVLTSTTGYGAAGTVYKYSADGSYSNLAALATGATTTAVIAVLNDGKVLSVGRPSNSVASSMTAYTYDFSAASPTWTALGTGLIEGFLAGTTPTAVEVDASGNIFVMATGTGNSTTIVAFAADGTKLSGTNGTSALPTSNFNSGDFSIYGSNLYVTDPVNSKVYKMSQIPTGSSTTWGTWVSTGTGVFSATAGKEGGKVTSPSGIAALSDKILVVDNQNSGWGNRVQTFNTSGSATASWRLYGGLKSPIGINKDSSGNVFVADASNKRIVKFDSAGKYVTSIGYNDTSTTGECYITSPSGVALDSSGNLYVTTTSTDASLNKISKFNSSFVYQTGSWPITVATPSGIALSSDAIYVVSNGAYGAGAYLRKYNMSGNETTVTNQWPISGLTSATEVTTDPNGYIYFTTGTSIRKVDSNGQAVSSISSAGTVTFGTLRGIAIDSNGYIFVVDCTNSKVYKITSAGGLVSNSADWSSLPTFVNLYSIMLNSNKPYFTDQGGDKQVRVFTVQ